MLSTPTNNTQLNIPRKKWGHLGLWGMGEYNDYHYRIFNEKARLELYHGKTFRNETEAPPELFKAIADTSPKGIIPRLKGIRNERMQFHDALTFNTLVAGQTQSGKTNWVKSAVVSMLHFAHPEYLKVIIFDPKTAAFKALKRVINVVNRHEEITQWLQKLADTLQKRIELTGRKEWPSNAKECNAKAYKCRSPKYLMPYIRVIFDEFADFMNNANKEARKNIDKLASLGLGLGMNPTFLTQAPYAKYIEGFVKNNFEQRIAFNLGDRQQEQLVLGKKPPTDKHHNSRRLGRGEFLAALSSAWSVHRTGRYNTLAPPSLAKNLEERELSFRIK